jgi:lysophospholipase L1-like esterase
LRFQLYGFAWASTGIDQHYPKTYTPRAADFDADLTWSTFSQPTAYAASDLAFDMLAAGVARAGAVPVLLVNEPMFVSDGQNSDLRYNAFYPRWAYSRYRQLLSETASAHSWALLDLWDTIAPDEFTDSPVHLTPSGARQLAEQIAPYLRQ